MAKILVTDKLAPTTVENLRKNSTVDIRLDLQPAELVKIIPKYDALLVRRKNKVTSNVIGAGKRLKVIGRAGVGLDNIDLETAKSKNIKVVNTPKASSNAVAEMTVGLALCLMRNIPRADASMKKGLWEKRQFHGSELSGKTWGIIGLGRIGSRVGKLAKAFGCRIVAHDPVAKDLKGAKKLGLEELMKTSDIISLHVPMTTETKGMISAKELSLMKPESVIINISRGGIVDEKALCEALKKREIRGAALDVYEKEPPENEITTLDNIVLTPHIGAATKEAQNLIGKELVEKLMRIL